MPKAKSPADRLMCAIANIDPDKKSAMKELRKFYGIREKTERAVEYNAHCQGGCAAVIPIKFKVPLCNRCLSETTSAMRASTAAARKMQRERELV